MYQDQYVFNISPKLFALLVVVFFLTAVDFTLTRTVVARGLIQEGNPLLVWAMECQIWGSEVLVAIGLRFKFVAQYGRDWVMWPTFRTAAT